MKITIDKTKVDFAEALGVTDFDGFATKADSVAKKIFDVLTSDTPENQEGEFDKTDAAQEIQENFSDNEILMLAAQGLSDRVENMLKEQALAQTVAKMIGKLGKIEEESKEEIGE